MNTMHTMAKGGTGYSRVRCRLVYGREIFAHVGKQQSIGRTCSLYRQGNGDCPEEQRVCEEIFNRQMNSSSRPLLSTGEGRRQRNMRGLSEQKRENEERAAGVLRAGLVIAGLSGRVDMSLAMLDQKHVRLTVWGSLVGIGVSRDRVVEGLVASVNAKIRWNSSTQMNGSSRGRNDSIQRE
ncbi:hypothetical protein Tco_0073276 [Tanacetum coccineum]